MTDLTIKLRGDLTIVHYDPPGDVLNERYEVFHKDVHVLNIQRSEYHGQKWIATDLKGRHCFDPNQYRNDLFEQIEFEHEFEE